MFFFFNDTATTEIYTLSLHDALPISRFGVSGIRQRLFQPRLTGAEFRAAACQPGVNAGPITAARRSPVNGAIVNQDRKSTRLNSSHLVISYAVFCLKKKTTHNTRIHT